MLAIAQVHRFHRKAQVGSSTLSSSLSSSALSSSLASSSVSSSSRFVGNVVKRVPDKNNGGGSGAERPVIRLTEHSTFDPQQDVYTAFDDECILHPRDDDESNQGGDDYYKNEDEDENESDTNKDDDDDNDDDDSTRAKKKRRKWDHFTLGRCQYEYAEKTPPPVEGGFVASIDFYFYRAEHNKRQQCYLFCLDHLDDDEITNTLLVQASIMGLTHVVAKLMSPEYSSTTLNPLALPDYKDHERPRLNAVQEAIRGGYAAIVKILTGGNNQMVIDSVGRTVADYVRMKGSPILARDAKSILLMTDKDLQRPTTVDERTLHNNEQEEQEDEAGRQRLDSGWSRKTFWNGQGTCDMDIIAHPHEMTRERFYNDYFVPGRPFLLRGFVPEPEVRAFDKARWETTERFHPRQALVKVGPTAYPTLTNQQRCSQKMTIEQLENATECPEMPGVPMVHARHPDRRAFKELFPVYKGNVYSRKGGWRMLRDWFDQEPWDYHQSWQVFFGGDGSGATLHWHLGAFNALYVGVKDWIITPPKYRGFSGMPAVQAAQLVDPPVRLQCTQYPGDMMYIPDYWGHLTLNRGFSIGAAVILPHKFQTKADATNKIYFVHINKTGGTNMKQMLNEHCPSLVRGHWGDGHRGFHASAHAFIDHFGRRDWNNAYTFAIVRHPLARQVSNFFFLMDLCSKENERMREDCKDRLIPAHLDLEEFTDEQKINIFHKYLWKLYEAYPPGHPEHYLFGATGLGNEQYKTFNATQTSWLVDETGKIAVDHIFQMERMADDIKVLAEALPCLKNNINNNKTGGEISKDGEDDDDDEEEEEETDDSDDDSTGSSSNSATRSGGSGVDNVALHYPDYKLFGRNERTNRIMLEVYGVDYQNFGYEFNV
ncbi:hypothetical protein ACA910_007055 [Epithemia clementina (nom. ined.)]